MRKFYLLLTLLCAVLFYSPPSSTQSTTQNIGLEIPAFRAVNWQVQMDSNLTLLDAVIGGFQTLPIGTTPAVPDSPIWVTANTSTTTITNFTGAYSGQRIQLLCGLGDTYTAVASSASINVTSTWSCSSTSKSLTLMYVNSSWWEVARSAGGGGGSPSIFTQFQFGGNTAITGTGNYIQLTTSSSSAIGLTQSGNGTSGNPYIDTIAIAIQGTDNKLLSSGTISGTGASLCTDSSGGATTVGCTSGGSSITVNGGSALGSPANFESGSAVTGITINVSNPSGNNVSFAISGTLTDAGLTSAYSGIGTCGSNQWASALIRNAAPTCTQPGFSNLSGSITLGQTVLTTQGDLLTVNSTPALVRLAVGVNNTVLISNGTSPSWGTVPNAALTNSSVTVSTSSPLGGGGSVSLGNSLTLTCSTCNTSNATVSSFSAGNLSPLFTTSVSTATTTPALTFTLSNAAQNSVLAGPASGGAGAPSYQTAPIISAANMTNFPTFNQNTIGTAGGLTGCTTSTAGSICYWTGSTWVVLAGNASGTEWLQETSVGVPSWTTPGGGGNVSTSGSPAQYQTAVWASSTTITGVGPGTTAYPLVSGGASANPSYAQLTSAGLNITTTTCTNQFLTAISSGGVGTCTTATLASAQFANQGTTTTLLIGNASGNLSWGAVNLSSMVTGQLPISSVGSSGLSGASPISINAAGVISVAGAAGEILAGATPAFTYTPTLGVSGTQGTLAMFPASGNFTTTWGSAATASNTILGFASAPTTLHLIECVTSSTTCTLTDAGGPIPASLANVSHKWLNSYTLSTGLFTQTQPADTDLTGTTAGAELYITSSAVAELATTAYSVKVSGATNPSWATPTANAQCFMSAASSYATTTPSFQSCPSAGVSSVSGDGTIITNSSSTGAVTLTISGTSGGIPYFSSSSSWASSGALTHYGVVYGGGAGGAPVATAADTTTTHAFFATATAPAFRAIATGDLPTGIPIANVGTSGLSGTSPITISAAGAIGCATSTIALYLAAVSRRSPMPLTEWCVVTVRPVRGLARGTRPRTARPPRARRGPRAHGAAPAARRGTRARRGARAPARGPHPRARRGLIDRDFAFHVDSASNKLRNPHDHGPGRGAAGTTRTNRAGNGRGPGPSAKAEHQRQRHCPIAPRGTAQCCPRGPRGPLHPPVTEHPRSRRGFAPQSSLRPGDRRRQARRGP